MKNACKSQKRIVRIVLVIFIMLPMTTFGRFLGLGGKSGQKELEDGIIAYEIQDYKTAAANFLAAAEKGNDEAQYYIGMCYYDGKGVQMNFTKALQWFRNSAEKGNADAMFQLGECCFNGTGNLKDTDEAIAWYRKSADKGGTKAMVKLGDFYYEGKYLEKNKNEAFKLWKKAAEKGNGNAMSRFAYCLFNGICTEKNMNEAIEWCRRPVLEQNTYSDKKQLEKYIDLVKAYDSAEKGDVDEMIKLGRAYQNGNSRLYEGRIYLTTGVEKDLKESIKWYHMAADKGNAEAMYQLGECYAHGGYGMEIDAGEAIKWYRKLADSGTSSQVYSLRSEKELENKIDSLTKYKKYLDTANDGDVQAMCEIGDRFMNRDQEFRWLLDDANSFETEAIKWYRKAADKGSGEAMFKIGKHYNSYSDKKKEALEWYSKAVEQFRKTAAHGDVSATNRLEELARIGNKDAQDVLKELPDLKKNNFLHLLQVAEQGNVKDLYKIGECYENGEGVEIDTKEAVKWYRKAAEQGDVAAINRLKKLVQTGYMDAQIALAEQGDADAQYMMGRRYETGNGVEQNDSEAINWYKKAAAQGNSEAQKQADSLQSKQSNSKAQEKADGLQTSELIDSEYIYAIGLKYETGDGVMKSYSTAYSFYSNAAEQGNAKAQTRLGLCYQYGRGTKINLSEAINWYRKAAEQGNAEAQNCLGECYFYGEGVSKDKEEAIRWYRKSAEQGNEYAIGVLKKLGY